MDFLAGFFAPWLIYLLITVFHLVLPGRWYDGYVKNEQTGELLRYRLNGWFVLIATIGLWAGLGYTDLVPYDWLYEHRWEGLAGACVFGLIFSAVVVFRANPVEDSLVSDFYLGRMMNPQLWEGRLDAKMWLYLIGAVMLELNVLSFSAAHLQAYPENPNPGVFLCAGMLTYFVCDYLTFERVHIYTYDIFAERVGFKLGWGCLLFYPYFYVIGLWSVVDNPNPGYPMWLLAVFGVIFISGWSLARGANMQKFFFKRDPERTFLGIEPKTISDGKKHLLSSGFWGVSRHINYLGEILMATGIALAVCHPGTIWPWLYPLYYVVLLFPRQRDDDIRCAEKYGELWDRYEEEVPYRIIPYIY